MADFHARVRSGRSGCNMCGSPPHESLHPAFSTEADKDVGMGTLAALAHFGGTLDIERK
jgi:hypothetical protein